MQGEERDLGDTRGVEEVFVKKWGKRKAVFKKKDYHQHKREWKKREKEKGNAGSGQRGGTN